MSLNQLIASYGREAATAPIEGYMKGVQFGSQMQGQQQARALGDLQLQQGEIQLGELQRTTTPDYIAEQERIAAEDRQIKNAQLEQVTSASRAQVKKWDKEGKLKDRLAHMEEAAPILRAASEMDPAGVKKYLKQNKEVLYKYLDDEGDKAMNTLFEKGGPEGLKTFAQLGYAGTTVGMEEAQKLKLLKAKGEAAAKKTSGKTSSREKIVNDIQVARVEGNLEKVGVLEAQLRNLDIKEGADAQKKISEMADIEVANTLGVDAAEFSKDDPTSFQYLTDSTASRVKEGENIDLVKSDISRYFLPTDNILFDNKLELSPTAEKELEQGQLQVLFNKIHGRKGLYKIGPDGAPRFVSWWNEDWSSLYGKDQ